MSYLGAEAAQTAHNSMLSFALISEDAGFALPQIQEDLVSPWFTSLYRFGDTIVTHAVRGKERLAPSAQLGYRLSQIMSVETPVAALAGSATFAPEALLGYDALRTVSTWEFTTPKKPIPGQELVKRSFGIEYIGVADYGQTQRRIDLAADRAGLLARICQIARPRWASDAYPLDVATDELDSTHIKHILSNLGWIAIAR